MQVTEIVDKTRRGVLLPVDQPVVLPGNRVDVLPVGSVSSIESDLDAVFFFQLLGAPWFQGKWANRSVLATVTLKPSSLKDLNMDRKRWWAPVLGGWGFCGKKNSTFLSAASGR